MASLTDDLREGRWGNVHALLVSRHGRMLYEQYFDGSDEILGDSLGTVEFGPNTLHDVRSISKTVTALLVGVALDSGLVSSVDAPLSDLLPDHRHLLRGSKSELTLRHVLTMSTIDPSPYSGLRLTARDLVKIGEVFASGGSFVGRRIVSEDWVREATRAQLSYDDEETPDFVVENGYGYRSSRSSAASTTIPIQAGCRRRS